MINNLNCMFQLILILFLCLIFPSCATLEGKNENSNLKPYIIGKDGVKMVLIPAGEFQMGSNYGNRDERPIHTVYLDAFYMDVYEVTNLQYNKFTNSTGYELQMYWYDPKFNPLDYPVVGVSWEDAMAYAKWAGKTLPTEAQWEKAGRGGLKGKKYPWGMIIDHSKANYAGTENKDIWLETCPVGSFPPNGYGLYDMAGNVWEWCLDWYDQNYYSKSPNKNPTGPESGLEYIHRGGSWWDDTFYQRVSFRGHYREAFTNIGFRCVIPASMVKDSDLSDKNRPLF